ncbi:MAG: hypothetical protein LBU95_05785 [Rikenellaceae bacterium]|jgi:hypothetical protein|nr:hypothetical protein [Rikenellaceae bacterium]
MKALFISYNQALTDRINEFLDRRQIRGYTKWELTQGRGSFTGEPHMGTHTWPSMNSSVLAMVEDDKIAPALEALRALDAELSMQGLRAFVWDVTEQL